MGTYAYVEFDTATKKQIHKYQALANLPNAVRPDKLHSTLLYSRVPMDGYVPAGNYYFPLVARPNSLAIWESKNSDGTVSKCLVVILSCPHLVERHRFLMEEHNGSFDFPTYVPHVTLSYDVHDLDINTLPFFDELVPHLVAIAEHSEPLDECVDIKNHRINAVDFI